MIPEIYQIIRKRQSDRSFDSSKRVEPEKIQRIIEAVRFAPSACNEQPWHFIVVDDDEKRMQVAGALASMGMNKFASQAPVHIVVVEEAPNFTARLGGWVKNKHFPHIDCGIAAAHIILAATAEGLGSCILGWFDEKKIKKILGIPSGKRVLMDIVIGYSTHPYMDKTRKPLNEIMSKNKY